MRTSFRDSELFWLSNAPRSHPTPRQPTVPTYRVGELLQKGRRRWPAGAQYSYGPNGHELTLFHSRIDDRLVNDVRSGETEFAVVVSRPLVVLAFRFSDSIPWNDVPYCWYMYPPHCRMAPPKEFSTHTRALLWATLVGANDGVIHAQRGLTLSPEFTRVLHDAIRAQVSTPFDPHAYMVSVNDLLAAHPNPLERLSLAQIRTIGNQ